MKTCLKVTWTDYKEPRWRPGGKKYWEEFHEFSLHYTRRQACPLPSSWRLTYTAKGSSKNSSHFHQSSSACWWKPKMWRWERTALAESLWVSSENSGKFYIPCCCGLMFSFQISNGIFLQKFPRQTDLQRCCWVYSVASGNPWLSSQHILGSLEIYNQHALSRSYRTHILGVMSSPSRSPHETHLKQRLVYHFQCWE